MVHLVLLLDPLDRFLEFSRWLVAAAELSIKSAAPYVLIHLPEKNFETRVYQTDGLGRLKDMEEDVSRILVIDGDPNRCVLVAEMRVRPEWPRVFRGRAATPSGFGRGRAVRSMGWIGASGFERVPNDRGCPKSARMALD